jgi:hypothetical protein
VPNPCEEEVPLLSSDIRPKQNWWQAQVRKDVSPVEGRVCTIDPQSLLYSVTKNRLKQDISGCEYMTMLGLSLVWAMLGIVVGVLGRFVITDALALRECREDCGESEQCLDYCNTHCILNVLLSIMLSIIMLALIATICMVPLNVAGEKVDLLVCAEESEIRKFLGNASPIDDLFMRHLLMVAIFNKNLPVVDLLLFKKININFNYSNPYVNLKPVQSFLKNLTPLEVAIKVSSFDIVTHLLDVGAKVEQRTLDYAAFVGNFAITRQLLFKRDIKSKQSTIFRALKSSVKRRNKTRILKLLLLFRESLEPLPDVVLAAAGRVSAKFAELLKNYNQARMIDGYQQQLRKDCGLDDYEQKPRGEPESRQLRSVASCV